MKDIFYYYILSHRTHLDAGYIKEKASPQIRVSTLAFAEMNR